MFELIRVKIIILIDLLQFWIKSFIFICCVTVCNYHVLWRESSEINLSCLWPYCEKMNCLFRTVYLREISLPDSSVTLDCQTGQWVRVMKKKRINVQRRYMHLQWIRADKTFQQQKDSFSKNVGGRGLSRRHNVNHRNVRNC